MSAFMNQSTFYLLLDKKYNIPIAIFLHYLNAEVMATEFLDESYSCQDIGLSRLSYDRNVMIIETSTLLGIKEDNEKYAVEPINSIYFSNIRVDNEYEGYNTVTSMIFSGKSSYITAMKIEPCNDHFATTTTTIDYSPICVSDTAVGAINNLQLLHERISL